MKERFDDIVMGLFLLFVCNGILFCGVCHQADHSALAAFFVRYENAKITLIDGLSQDLLLSFTLSCDDVDTFIKTVEGRPTQPPLLPKPSPRPTP